METKDITYAPFRLGILLGLMALSSCIASPDFSDTPALEFIGLSKASMVQGDLNNDSLIVILSFTDGDGDIGSPSSGNKPNLFVIDNRTQEIYDNIKLPQIPQEGANNGVKGTIYLKLFNACCLFDDRPNCTVSPEIDNIFDLDIYLVDEAGNQSNTVTTSKIALLCL